MNLVIKNGTVVNASGTYRADIGITGERITQVAADISPDGAQVLDAQGKFVLPGAIDAHTHMEWPRSADDFESGTIAAACGGVTTIIDFAVQYKGKTLRETMEDWRSRADAKVCIDYGLHLVVSDFNEDTPREMQELVGEGVTSFKMWMTSSHSGGLGVDDGTIYQVMEVASQLGALVGLHCENDPMMRVLINSFLRAGKTSPEYHRLSRPPFVEAEAIRRVATIAEATDCALYIPHMSSAAGRVALREAQRRGVRVVAETCPQFLALTDKVYRRPDAARFVMSPPIKTAADQAELWRGLAEGDIVSVGSDHCPYSDERKAEGRDDFTKIPNGVPGTEAIVPLLYGKGVACGRLTLEQMVAVTAENPARLFGLYPRKGVIVVGSDADLVIFDPACPMRLDAKSLHSQISYSIYDDITVPGRPVATIARGELIAREGEFSSKKARGKFLARALPDPAIWEHARHV
ncbi:MAG TPA: dihydropyrimidinase [Anaerolineae bacterium]|nr:dihydropyrimidinase [Anaerolineae bacterium]